MIKHYSDHAANERTFLAWVRTAIAVMAFGFLIERFDLFLRFAQRATLINAPQAAEALQPPPGHYHANDMAGVFFIVLGIMMMLVAAVRLRRTAKEIDRDNVEKTMTARTDITFIALLIIFSIAMCLTLFQVFVSFT